MSQTFRKQLFWLLLSFLASISESGATLPNIVIILADDLGVGETSIEFSKSNGKFKRLQSFNTPNIKRLSKTSTVFTKAYSPAPICSASRASILTGRHTGISPIRGNTGQGIDFKFPELTENLPRMLKSSGYHNALIGKWGFEATKPVDVGFDSFYGQKSHQYSHNYFPYRITNNSKDEVIHQNVAASEKVCTADPRACAFAPDLYIEKAEEFIESRSNKSQPFFLLYSHLAPHHGTWRDKDSLGGREGPTERQHNVSPLVASKCRLKVPGGTDRLEECRYKSLIEDYLDRDVGRIVDKLKSLRLEEETMLIFTSDNGPQLSTKISKKIVHNKKTFGSVYDFSGQKRTLREGGIRVPLLIQFPGQKAPDQNKNMFLLSDLKRTIESMLPDKAPRNQDLNSVSAYNTVGLKNRKFIYFEYCPDQVDHIMSLRSSSLWKRICSYAVIHRSGLKLLSDHVLKKEYLFDLIQDPSESRNLWRKRKLRGLRNMMLNEIDTLRRRPST